MTRFFIFILTCCIGLGYAQPNGFTEEDLNFVYSGNRIVGKLITPVRVSEARLPVIVFIHGSGPEDFNSSGDYNYLWSEFTKVGYACYSWSRPGVGQSEGRWYEMSVYDRANEVLSAIVALKKSDKIDQARIGLWGISQAGWVIPIVAKKIDPAFVITISSPVTTAFEQELYRVEASLGADGFDSESIRQAIDYCKSLKNLIDERRSFDEFTKLQKETAHASWINNVIRGDEVVYKYLSIVFRDDKAPDLSSMRMPVLAIWGENDLVVPPTISSETYHNALTRIKNEHARIEIIPDADHTMTFNLSGRNSDTWKRRKDFRDNPEKIFAPDYVSLMIEWLKSTF
ncbi:MAG: alpha/beta hydrolase family protein [Cyclobacteriaceae bacterium]